VKDGEAIKVGILGAALIAPFALINPAASHPEVVVHAVAARDKAKAEAYAKKYGIPKAFGGPNGYQGVNGSTEPRVFFTQPAELLDDPEIDAIYNPVRAYVVPTHASESNPVFT
jgi:predicted dehydrogenase